VDLNIQSVKERVGVLHDIIVTLAAIAGGAWALLRFKRERADESAIDMDVSVRTDKSSANGASPVFIEAKLKNVGKTKIQAKPTTKNSGPAYQDTEETLEYSGSLKVRHLVPSAGMVANLDWYDASVVTPIASLPEINLLSDYEIPEQENLLDFWKEPGETYVLGKTIALAPGLYLAKATFIGARNDGDFWTRLTQFSVPG
jgi:hypothetical protein